MAATSSQEEELVGRIFQEIPKAFGQGHDSVTMELVIDEQRNSDFMLVIACFDIENKLNEFDDLDFERIINMHPNIKDVYLEVEPATNTYTVVVDIARENMSQSSNQPLFKPPPENVKVEPVDDASMELLWPDARDKFSSDGQASLGFAIATHLTQRLTTWCGESSEKGAPTVNYKPVPNGNKKVTVFSFMPYGGQDKYRISGTVIAQVKRLVQDRSFIDSVAVVFKVQGDKHVLSLNVVIDAVSNSATGFYPHYKAPKVRKNVRDPFDEGNKVSSADKSSALSRRNRLKKQKASRQRA